MSADRDPRRFLNHVAAGTEQPEGGPPVITDLAGARRRDPDRRHGFEAAAGLGHGCQTKVAWPALDPKPGAATKLSRRRLAGGPIIGEPPRGETVAFPSPLASTANDGEPIAARFGRGFDPARAPAGRG